MPPKKIDPTLKNSSRAYEAATYIQEAAYLQAKGGINLSRHHALLPLGGFSDIQNMRPRRPGFKQRAGCIQLHSTADGGGTPTKVVNLGAFSKGKKSEIKFYAQMSDGDVLQATNNPPTVTVGAFGSVIHTSADPTSMLPASFSTLIDRLIYADGTGYPYIYSGAAEYVKQFVVIKMAAAIPIIPLVGQDFSVQVADEDTTTVATLNSLSVLTDFDAIFIRTDVPPNAFTFTVQAANGDAAVMQAHYWNGDWAAVTAFADTTIASAGKTLGQTGTMSWTMPTDHKAHFMFGSTGFWTRLSLATGALDAAVSVSKVTFESSWVPIINMWDGIPISCIEGYVYDAANTQYEWYDGTSIAIGATTASDKTYVGLSSPCIGLYLDVGAVPNTVAAALTVKYNANGAWTTVGASLSDGTSENSTTLGKNGWVTWARPADETPTLFQSSNLYQYWYELSWNATLTTDMVLMVTGMPIFDMTELGKCYNACAWRGRVSYAFEKAPGYILISGTNNPMVLNGPDSAFQEIGDGRENKVVAQRPFHSELIVWQEEKGVEGGTCSLIQGYDPSTFGKYMISTKYGTFSQKSTCVVEGVPNPVVFSGGDSETGDATFAFWLSRYGLLASDGRKAKLISHSVSVYFDPRETTTCIRAGYEKEHWISFDSSDNIIRIGLVTGTTATTCNTFLTYDILSGEWSHDILTQEFSSYIEIEAASGSTPVLQCGGGTDDGLVYLSNYGTNDNGTAIDSFIKVELDAMGYPLHAKEMFVRTATVNATSIRSATYAWTLSTQIGSTSEYYCRLANGNNPSLTDPIECIVNGTAIPRGILGSLNPGEFAYGDNDTLGYSVIYIRLSDNTDPDTKSAGYVSAAFTGLIVTPYINNVAQTARNFSMVPEIANESLRRHRFDVNTEAEHISIKMENNTLDMPFQILDYGMELLVYRDQ